MPLFFHPALPDFTGSLLLWTNNGKWNHGSKEHSTTQPIMSVAHFMPHCACQGTTLCLDQDSEWDGFISCSTSLLVVHFIAPLRVYAAPNVQERRKLQNLSPNRTCKCTEVVVKMEVTQLRVEFRWSPRLFEGLGFFEMAKGSKVIGSSSSVWAGNSPWSQSLLLTLLESGLVAGEVLTYFWPLSKGPKCPNAQFDASHSIMSMLLMHTLVHTVYK